MSFHQSAVIIHDLPVSPLPVQPTCVDDRLLVVPDDRLLPVGVRPPRVNLAGVCAYCNERGCTSERCIQIWSMTRWAICPDCDGTEVVNVIEHCWCTSGVVDVRELPAS